MKYLNNWNIFENNSRGKSITLIKIDSRKRTVDLILVDNWDYHKITELIGHGCRHFEAPYSFPNQDTLFTDEEFLVRDFDLEIDEVGMYDPSKFGFVFLPFSPKTPLWGNGLVIGTDKEGESISTKTPLELIRRKVLFLEKVSDNLSDVKIWQWNGTKYIRTR